MIFDLHKLDSFENDFVVFHGISAMKSKLSNEILRGRPFGGITTLIKKSFYKKFSNVLSVKRSERFLVLKLDKLLIVNVYLPCCSCDDDYELLFSILNDLLDIISEVEHNSIIIGGDFNCNLLQYSTGMSIIQDFIHKINSSVCNNLLNGPCTIEYTYVVENRNAYSNIDYFIVSNSLSNSINNYQVIHSIENMSDHLPVELELNSNFYIDCVQDSPINNSEYNEPDLVEDNYYTSFLNRFDWSLTSSGKYYECTRISLMEIYNKLNLISVDQIVNRTTPLTVEDFNSLFNEMVLILQTCTQECVPLREKTNCHKKCWWDNNLQEEKSHSIRTQQAWIKAGKPRSGNLYNERLKARKNYRKLINEKKVNFQGKISTNLKRSLYASSSKTFWRIWNTNFHASKLSKKHNVNNLKTNTEIANYLANNFRETCTPNNEKLSSKFRSDYFAQKLNYSNSDNIKPLDIALVEKSISNISEHKAAGFDTLTIECIKQAHPSLIIVLTKMFNFFLFNGIVPDNFGLGITTAIPKFSGSKPITVADDYRGITVNTVISKIFEYCILDYLTELKTSSRQFGFKKGIGCTHSIHTVRKVINHFHSKGSTINIGVIDLRKAFDKVNYFALLATLQKFHVNVHIISLLENWFSKNFTIVKWEDTFSQNVQLNSGVRQGGILSPLLFSIYVDSVLKYLENSKLGCFVNYQCYNSFMYADDLILLSTSVTDLQLMFNLCSAVFSMLDLPINVNKSHCMRVGARFDTSCANITLCNEPIQWVDSIKFLGVILEKGKKLKFNWDASRRNFYSSVNSILGKLGVNNDSTDVLFHLVKSKAVPYLTYGICTVNLSKQDLNKFNFAYNSVFSKVFKSFDNAVIKTCQYYCGFLSFEYMYEFSRLKFLQRLIDTNFLNEDHVLDTNDFKDYHYLKNKYAITKCISITVIWKHFGNSLNL